MALSKTFQTSKLNGKNGFQLLTNNYVASVSDAGDINGDGIDDIIIGVDTSAYGPRRVTDPNRRNAGESYVIFGSENGFAKNLRPEALNGRNGFVLKGVDASDYSGRSVSGAGDVNGDGIDDLIIGAANGDALGQKYAGESYVVFGSRARFQKNFELADLNGRNGFTIDGANVFTYSGSSVSRAGDVNGDGLDDVILKAAGSFRSNDPRRACLCCVRL